MYVSTYAWKWINMSNLNLYTQQVFYIVFMKKCTTIMKCHRSQNKKFLVSGNGICCTVSVEVGYQLKVNQKSGDFKFSFLGFIRLLIFPFSQLWFSYLVGKWLVAHLITKHSFENHLLVCYKEGFVFSQLLGIVTCLINLNHFPGLKQTEFEIPWYMVHFKPLCGVG